MLRVLALLLTLCCAASAQVPTTGAGAGSAYTAPSYIGPGDVVSGATAFWGLRAYNGAYASAQSKLANICTPLDAVCADVSSNSSGNFNLSAVGSLTCNNSTSICTVKTLYDQTGNGNDLTEATIASRPVLTVNCLNTSLPCMTFTPTQHLETSALSVSTSYTITGVGEATSGSFPTFFSSNSGGAALVYLGATAKFYCYNNLLSQTQAQGTFHTIAGVCDDVGGTAQFSIDGNIVTGSLAFAALSGTTALGDDTQGDPLTGSIAEAGIWASEFNSTQIGNMNSNQNTYWGL